jgi:ankyrin repeat protein
VKFLLENGAIVNTRNEYGYTALLLAASTPIHELEEETQKMNEGKTDAEQKFMSPIEINDTICQLLLAQNPDVNLADNNGQTPLMFVSFLLWK